MHTWTDNPLREVWKHLKFLSYKENCKNLLIGNIKSGRELIFSSSDESLDRKVNEITTCIQQGIEYFDAANRVTINTSPLLIYYGILSLTKALIISNSSDKYIDDIKYHGLTTRPYTESLQLFRNNKGDWSIEEEFAIVHDGVFSELNKLIDNREIIPKGSIITIKRCLSCVPEIKEFYEKLYQEHSNTFNMHYGLHKYQDSERLSFAPEFDESIDALYSCIPQVLDDFDYKDELPPHFYSKKDMNVNEINYMYNYHSCIGGDYFVCEIDYELLNGQNNRIIINQILIDYIVTFILGEQVRYHQDLWCKVVKGESSGSIALIEIYLDIVKRRYPHSVLNRLFGENFTYGAPAYMN